MDLEEEFTQALWGTVEAAKAKKYYPTYFMHLLEMYDGVQTAKRLLASQDIQTGLFELYDRELLDVSMEAVVLQEKFQPLFTREELAEAHRRLEELDYFK